MAANAMSQDLSGWSDKTVCRQLLNNPDNTDYVQEADSRSLVCGSSTQSSNEIIDLKKANGGSKVSSLNGKTRNSTYKKISSDKPKDYNKELCEYKNKWSYSQIENLLELKKYNFLTIEAFGPTDDKISMLNQHLDMYVTAFISKPIH